MAFVVASPSRLYASFNKETSERCRFSSPLQFTSANWNIFFFFFMPVFFQMLQKLLDPTRDSFIGSFLEGKTAAKLWEHIKIQTIKISLSNKSVLFRKVYFGPCSPMSFDLFSNEQNHTLNCYPCRRKRLVAQTGFAFNLLFNQLLMCLVAASCSLYDLVPPDDEGFYISVCMQTGSQC